MSEKFSRRNFLKGAGAGIPMVMLPTYNLASPGFRKSDTYTLVHFLTDGVLLSPAEYSKLLVSLTEKPGFRKDNEGHGGVLADLERKFAEHTGKESAIYMPTGTMANQLAIRVLSRNKSKVYVQETSHVFNNESDAAQTLHHKRLMPLNKGKTTFTLEELKADINQFKRIEIFRTEVGAISIENPVKRNYEEVFDIAEIRKISRYAKANGIKTHLDGARLHMASAYSGISIKEYASYFDTIYLSLYKYFGASAGAMLCGDAETISQMANLIKICGGNMASNWPETAVANFYFEGFEKRYRAAKLKAEKLFARLNASGKLKVEKMRNGSNVHKLTVPNAEAFRNRMSANGGILVRRMSRRRGFIPIKVNETILKVSNNQLADWFISAAS